MRPTPPPSRWSFGVFLPEGLPDNGLGPVRWVFILAPIYFIAFAAFLFLFYLHNHPMWTDAWRLQELSQTVFGRFYESNFVTTFQGARRGGRSADFPPLWPVVMAGPHQNLAPRTQPGVIAA